jgi:iron complex outermembrane receptor protein
VEPVVNRRCKRGGCHLFHSLLISTSVIALGASLAPSPGVAQTVTPPAQATPEKQEKKELPQVSVSGKRAQRGAIKKPRPDVVLHPETNAAGTPSPSPVSASPSQALAGTAMTPLDSVAASASRLGLPVIETPASVDIVNRQTIQEQGYRTTTETAQGAVGVLSGDAGGAPASSSIRGFTDVNVLYNGISVGPQSVTARWMDTGNLDQVEFLKGPSSLMTGLDAIGGAINYVNRLPTTGPVKNEIDTSLDSMNSFRTHYGSGGTIAPGLDYRFDAVDSKLNSFIDGDFRNLGDLSGQLNYHATNNLMVFAALEYKQDSGHAYWGTPLVPTSFAGSHAVNGVVSGASFSEFDGSLIAPVTIDNRTLTTNYNVTDNATGAKELWVRGGAEWTPLNNVTLKDQVYYYKAQRNWIDSETYSFDGGSIQTPPAPFTIAQDRFAVSHDQKLVGNNVDFSWDSMFFGMENRLASQLQLSRNTFSFKEDLEGDFPSPTPVAVVDPTQQPYGPIVFDTRDNWLDDVAMSFEDRLKLTSNFALIGGVRVEDIRLTRNGENFDGTIPEGEPFTKSWAPVSYRAAYTYEPIPNLMFYSMYATAYNASSGLIFSVNPTTNTEQLTSTRTYETGVKQILWNGNAEWTLSLYDIKQRNVFVQIDDVTSTLAGEVGSKGVELAGAVRPVDGLKLWANMALTQARFLQFDDPGVGSFTGNTPPDVAPIIVNAGASYRFNDWRWPVEFGGSVRHVGNRYVFQDDATTMLAYTTGDVYAFVDIPGKDLPWRTLDALRVTFRVRNITNAIYAQWADPGLANQVLLGDPRTYEVAASAKW